MVGTTSYHYGKPSGYQGAPGTCRWCGDPLRPQEPGGAGGWRDNGVFCSLRCGYQWADTVAALLAGLTKLAGLAEVAALAGVSRTRAGQLAAHPDFPEPLQRLAMGPVWLQSDVHEFLATPRKPGRRHA